MITKAKFADTLIDFVWPRLVGPSHDDADETNLGDTEVTAIKGALGCEPSSEDIKELRASLQYTYNLETQRRASLDSRLGALAGLTAAAGAIAIGAIGASASSSPTSEVFPAAHCISAVARLYVLTQFCNASLNAIRGLSTKHYTSVLAAGTVRRHNQSGEAFVAMLSKSYLSAQYSLTAVNNEKASRMRCSYQAIVNALVAMLVIGLAATILEVVQH